MSVPAVVLTVTVPSIFTVVPLVTTVPGATLLRKNPSGGFSTTACVLSRRRDQPQDADARHRQV